MIHYFIIINTNFINYIYLKDFIIINYNLNFKMNSNIYDYQFYSFEFNFNFNFNFNFKFNYNSNFDIIFFKIIIMDPNCSFIDFP
jgi:hypothetical protein